MYATHSIPTAGTNAWSFNGNVDSPTLQPSILVHGIRSDGDITLTPRCHSYVTNGCIQYLDDCEHALRGQTVELPEVAA